jgi:hypothetical protein
MFQRLGVHPFSGVGVIVEQVPTEISSPPTPSPFELRKPDAL